MTYTLIVHPQALRDLQDVPARYRRRIMRLIGSLTEAPNPPHSKQLEEPVSHLRRGPLEQQRVICDVVEDPKEVNVYDVRQKKGPETHEDLD